MIDSNRRIFLAIFLSLVIFFGIRYISLNPSVFSPGNIYAGVVQKTQEIKVKIFSIRLPDFSKIFTLSFNPSSNETMKQWNNNNQNNSFNLPTAAQPIQPTSSPANPTEAVVYGPTPTSNPYTILTPTNYNRVPTGTRPTSRPQPTNSPAPKPITSDKRPGNTLGEIFAEVSKRICVPPALLRAFQEEETGSWFHYDDNPGPYNTYGWWKTGSGDPCVGFGYHTATGIVPSDSVKAGTQCKNPVGGTDIGIMGLIQISQQEEEVSRKNTIAFLPNSIDRRVIFDNALIFASITINRVVEPPCGEEWSDDVVRLAAEKHQGVCQYDYGNGNVRNYCDDILSLYKKYR